MKKMLFAAVIVMASFPVALAQTSPLVSSNARPTGTPASPLRARRNPCKPCIFAGTQVPFNLMALATDPFFGNNIWTMRNGAAGIDVRSTSVPSYAGDIWVVWDNSITPNQVTAYLVVDSIVANQLFFAVPGGVLSIPPSEIGMSGENLVPSLTDTPLPAAVQSILNGAPIGAAITDVRPEDAQFGVNRALASLDAVHYNGLGYGPGPIGSPVLSTYSSKSATPVEFAILGKDPITGSLVPLWTTTSFGAEPIIVFVNSSLTGPADFGNQANFRNITRFDLARIVNGRALLTRDISSSSRLPAVPVNVLLADPISGTANIFEFCIPRNVELNSTQELGVNPETSGGNPLNIVSATGGWRRRVIGTPEMTSQVSNSSNGDVLGYAVWSTTNFGNIANTRYLTVDGIDPLFASYSGGAVPSCHYPCPGQVRFPNIANGSYPLWSMLRVVSATPVPPQVLSTIESVQNLAVTFAPDFVPFNQMAVFRSHFSRPGVNGSISNGHINGKSEAGGDEGGAVLTVQSDLDSVSETGKEIISLKQ